MTVEASHAFSEAVVNKGKGKGKGTPPPPPKERSAPPPSAKGCVLKVTVCDGNLRTGVETTITEINGSRHIQRSDGTIEEIKQIVVEDKPHNGRMADPSWPLPSLAAECSELARPSYRAGKAHEYLDDEEVLRCKVALLADMLREAKHVVVYGGAGLSTASGISDYATRTGSRGVLAQGKASQSSKVGAPVSWYSAKPNLGHRVVSAMARHGLVWRFVQQNHDGLPQKAGMPQHLVNEIHGGLFDPSNPVVPMSGNVRSDLFQDLLLCERKADVVLTLGSSLAGMNADRLVKTCAERARRPTRQGDAPGGSVIVSLQTTPHDAESSVRIYATIDRTMELLAEELSLELPPLEDGLPSVPLEHRPLGALEDVFEVPYDSNGQRNLAGVRRRWDLRERSVHHITIGPNKGARAIVLGKLDDTHYRIGIRLRAEFQGDWEEVRILGSWWVDAAVAGQVDVLPMMSVADDE